MPSFRSSGSFGKRQEYITVAELLKHGYDVYMTLVDDQQIDCVVRIEVDSHPVYGRYSIVFTNTRKDGKPYPRPGFDAWRDNWAAFNGMAHGLSSGHMHRTGESAAR